LSNHVSNFPTAQASRVLSEESGDFTKDTINSILALGQKGKPRNETELKERINDFFSFCSQRSFKPGVEALSLSLGVTRACFWNWTNGVGVSEEWKDICVIAKQSIITYIEAAAMSGKLNPATSIFILKNVGNYKDQISFEDTSPNEADHKNGIKAVMLPVLKDNESINANFNGM
jgi:hypothetical protein